MPEKIAKRIDFLVPKTKTDIISGRYIRWI
jgi:hypothetical protein